MAPDQLLILRDPIHGFIRLSAQERQVIDTLPMQRLRCVKQLGLTDLVYPSAVHTRFAHSIGAMHVAGLMAKQVGLPEEDVKVVRLCLLLHDIGHGPFSHLFDFVCNEACGTTYDHEVTGRAIVSHSETIKAALGDRYDRVMEGLSPKRSVLRDIVSSGLDADKLDYLRRDSYFAGVEYGRFDFNRILWTLGKDDGIGHLVVSEKGMDSIEGFRLARLLMHAQVYTHHTRLIVDRMLCRSAGLYAEGSDTRKADFKFGTDSGSASRLLALDDDGLLDKLDQTTSPLAKEILLRLRDRRLFKRGYEISMDNMPPDARTDILQGKLTFSAFEQAVAADVRIDPGLVFVVAPRLDDKQYHSASEPILIKLDGGQTIGYDLLSLVKISEGASMRKFYVFGPEDSVPAIRASAAERINAHR